MAIKSISKQLAKLNNEVDRARAKAPRGASRNLKPPAAVGKAAEPVTSDGKTVGWVWFDKKSNVNPPDTSKGGGGNWWHWSTKEGNKGGDCMTKREAFLQTLKGSGSL